MNNNRQKIRFGNPSGIRSRPSQPKRASSLKKLSSQKKLTPRNSITFETFSKQTSYEYRDYDYLREHFLQIVDDPSQEKAYELLQELNRNYRYEFEYKIMRDVLQKMVGTNDFAFGDTWSHEFDDYEALPMETRVSVPNSNKSVSYRLIPKKNYRLNLIDRFRDILTVKLGDNEWKIDPNYFCYKGKAFRFFCTGFIASVQRKRMLSYYMTLLKDKYSSVLSEQVPYCKFVPFQIENIPNHLTTNIKFKFEQQAEPYSKPTADFLDENKKTLHEMYNKILETKENCMFTFLISLFDPTGGHSICCFAHVIIVDKHENGYMQKDIQITLVDNNQIEIYSLDVIYNLLFRDISFEPTGNNQKIHFSLQEKISVGLNWGDENNKYILNGHCNLISFFIAELGWYIANTLPRKNVRSYFSFLIKSVLYNLSQSGTDTVQSLISTYYISVLGTFFEHVSDKNTTLQKHVNTGDVLIFQNSNSRLNHHVLRYANCRLYFESIKNECITTLVGIELPNSSIERIKKLPDFLKLRRQKMNGVSFFVPDMKEVENKTPSNDLMTFSSMLDRKKQLALDLVNNKYRYGNISSDSESHEMLEDWKFVFLSAKPAIKNRRKLAFKEIYYSEPSYIKNNDFSELHTDEFIIYERPLIRKRLLVKRLNLLERILVRYNIYDEAEEFFETGKLFFRIFIICFLLDSLYRYLFVKDEYYRFGFGNEGQIMLRKLINNEIIVEELNKRDYPNLIRLGRNADTLIQKAQSLSSKQKKKAFHFFVQNFQNELELTPEEISSVSAMLGIN